MTTFRAFVLIFSALTTIAHAEDFLVRGGRSADGLYEVRLVRTPNYDSNTDGTEYRFQICRTSDNKSLYTVSGSGFRGYSAAQGYCEALWSPSGGFVAFTDRYTKHTNKIYVLSVTPEEATQLEIPNYVDNAIGRVNATGFDFACVSTPKKWHDNHLSVTLYFTANGRHSYTSNVTLHAVRPEHPFPVLVFEAITDPKEGEE